MSGGLGFKHTFREKIFLPLEEYRGNHSTGGRDISLDNFMKTPKMAEFKNSSGEALSLEDIWVDFGISVNEITLSNLLARPDDARWLVPEVIRDFVDIGFKADPWYQDITTGSANIYGGNNGPTIIVPTVKWGTQNAPAYTGQGATPPESTVTYSHKTITLDKCAIALWFTDEFLMSVRIPVIQPYLADVGSKLAAKLNADCVDTIVNGDQADGSDAITYIGVNSTSDKLKFLDLVRVWIRGSQIQRNFDTIITNEEMAWRILNLAEFSTPNAAGGLTMVVDSRKRILPNGMVHRICSTSPDNMVILVDKSACVQHLQYMPLKVESERIVMQGLNGTLCSVIEGFSTVNPSARIEIDEAKAYSGYGFDDDLFTPLC